MKRNFKKAFTLVEMLIVIIIIGILMAALFPKLKGAQGAARDTARKTGLHNISTALFQYQSNEGVYPTASCTSDLEDDLGRYLKSMPSDPQAKRVTYGTKTTGCTSGSFAYAPLYHKGSKDAGYILVANTESEGKNSNFVVPDITQLTFTGVAGNVAKIANTPKTNLTAVSDTANDFTVTANAGGNFVVYDSSVIPVMSCKAGVEIVEAAADQTMCNNGHINKGKTRVANGMVYVVSE